MKEDTTPNIEKDAMPDTLLSDDSFSKVIKGKKLDEEFRDNIDVDNLKYDALEHLTGYICHQLRYES